MSKTRKLAAQLSGAIAAAALLGASQAHALTITSFFDSSITSASNAAAVEAAINTATQFYSQFNNAADVKIVFQVGGGLGGSNTTLYSDTYNHYTGALAFDAAGNPQNAPLATALANLGFGNNKDIILGTSANYRALGFDTPGAFGTDGVFGDGDYDAVITLNIGIMNFTDVTNPALYPANPVIQHEIDEVLGIGGPGSLVDQPFGSAPFGKGITYMGAEDLYRYSAAHTASFTTSSHATSYFSIDGGVTNIRGFNQGPGGDFADWVTDCNGAQFVQDFQGCPGKPQIALDRNAPEAIGLQAIGYNFDAAVPEPAAWALMISGFGLVGAALRRRRVAVTA